MHHVLEVIEQKTAQLKQKQGNLATDVIDLRKNFWDEIKVNLETFDDRLETALSIKQQAEFLAERELTHHHRDKALQILRKLKDSPYFARVDFTPDDTNETTPIYIGIAGLSNETEDDYLIYDWRAPISSMYYDFSPGPAEYASMEKIISGTMDLKRQFIIRHGELQSMFDTNVAIGDELLKEVLGNNASDKMKNIVATIQKEQNQIIRNVKNNYLIVQGVAGSGKTSVALQRAAYLLYHYKEELNNDNMLLFSPNPLFSSYIASVLPDLGETSIQQLTFQAYVEKRLGKHLTMESPFSQMEYLLTTENAARKAGIRFKASLAFKEYIDQYAEQLSTGGLVFKNIALRGNVIISKEAIGAYFYSLDHTISIPNRMNMTKDWLLEELAFLEKEERDKDWVKDEAELLDIEDYTEVYHDLQDNAEDDTFDDFDKELKILTAKIARKYFRKIRAAVSKLKFLHVTALYKKLFDVQADDASLPENWDAVCVYTLESLRQKELLYEDTSPYMYLEDKLTRLKTNTQIKHLFIDEAQDYSPFQFFVLQQLFPSARMTILGDIHQAIYMHTLNSATLFSGEEVQTDNIEKIELHKSYRSTRQIVDFTRHLLAVDLAIEPFERDGEKPSFVLCMDGQERDAKLRHTLSGLVGKEYGTIAVICKTAAESAAMYEQLSPAFDVQLATEHSYSYDSGIIVLPAYLAKGIEFDAVIIPDASAHNYEKSFEQNLFYTACTRAMHELVLFAVGDKTPFMDRVPADFYTLA
ncbi:UvrD-helicase domain-containing protein [Listeria booriae]|uniref:UvrD-helicase domain-containing protein n=2 Tax=Listeria booriae TaxID=1552123 RepID=A0A842CLU5_9LIST|nr:UvrD-helicase domain-containing protein [Listeria booriae]